MAYPRRVSPQREYKLAVSPRRRFMDVVEIARKRLCPGSLGVQFLSDRSYNFYDIDKQYFKHVLKPVRVNQSDYVKGVRLTTRSSPRLVERLQAELSDRC